MPKLEPHSERMLFAPLIWRLALRLEQATWSDVARDAGEAVFVLRSAQRLFKQDIHCPTFDTWMELEAAGVAVERDELGRIATASTLTADPASAATVLNAPAIACAIEVVRRLAADESSVVSVGTLTGPATLLARVGAEHAAWARDVAQALGRAYCEAGAGALMLLEEEPVGDMATLSSLLNIAEYYATPVFVLSRLPITPDHVAAAQSAGVSIVGPNLASDGIALIGGNDAPAGAWIALSNWELDSDTDPNDIEAARVRLLGTV